MSENIYAPPTSNLSDDTDLLSPNLASRWQRLAASILDGMLNAAIFFGLIFVTIGWEQYMEYSVDAPFIVTFAGGFIGLFIFALLNGRLLVTKSQTIGKKALGLKIVAQDDTPVTLSNHLLKRYSVYILPQCIPFIGGFFSIVNILFIFGKQKRCIHDMIADTKVIKL